jgi:S-DNA-T family DNA segregation ATPase FtsK/SpoIIIE
MLYVPNGGKMIRVHGPFVSDSEINAICKYLRENHKTNYIDFESVVLSLKSQEVKDENSSGESSSKGDYEKAVEIVLAERKTSISYIQRRLRIGYNKAASFVEQMEEEGILSPADHTGKRRILGDES